MKPSEKRAELEKQAERLGLKIDRHNGRYSVGKTGVYHVDAKPFSTLEALEAYLDGWQAALDDLERQWEEEAERNLLDDDAAHKGYLQMYGAEDREGVLINLSSKTV